MKGIACALLLAAALALPALTTLTAQQATSPPARPAAPAPPPAAQTPRSDAVRPAPASTQTETGAVDRAKRLFLFLLLGSQRSPQGR